MNNNIEEDKKAKIENQSFDRSETTLSSALVTLFSGVAMITMASMFSVIPAAFGIEEPQPIEEIVRNNSEPETIADLAQSMEHNLVGMTTFVKFGFTIMGVMMVMSGLMKLTRVGEPSSNGAFVLESVKEERAAKSSFEKEREERRLEREKSKLLIQEERNKRFEHLRKKEHITRR